MEGAKPKKQRGVALLLALMMTAFIVLLVVFVSSIGSGQLRFAGSSTDSTRAFSAADAGIEYALSRINLGLVVGQDAASCKCGAGWCPSTPLSSNVQYCVTADNPSRPKKITAIGRTTDTSIRRSIEVVLPAFGIVNQMATICFDGTGSVESPNSMCAAQTYAGATGVIGVTSTDCTGASGASLISPASTLARSDRTFTTVSTNFYVVQCYK
ncbi:MAG: hypothetical protein Q7S09_02175 [bacterium]|nr:hypothetical protein [bacterium]